jgi:hypothetical protein
MNDIMPLLDWQQQQRLNHVIITTIIIVVVALPWRKSQRPCWSLVHQV